MKNSKFTTEQLQDWMSKNCHNKMTAKEYIIEVACSGFDAEEIAFLIKAAAMNDTFKFKKATR